MRRLIYEMILVVMGFSGILEVQHVSVCIIFFYTDCQKYVFDMNIMRVNFFDLTNNIRLSVYLPEIIFEDI